MTKVLLKRLLVWALLIISLIVFTVYNRRIFVNSLKTEIEELHKEEQDSLSKIKIKKTEIDRYNNVYFDNNTIALMIPENDNILEIQQKYLLRPISVSEANMLNFSITESMPGNLNLPSSSKVKAKKITLTMEIKDNRVDDFFNELYNSQRCVYFGNFNYKLPDERERQTKNPPYTVVVNIEYYIFYVKTDNTKTT